MQLNGPFLLILLISCAFVGCASKLVVQSEPDQVEVYASVEGKKDRVKIGETPFELTEVQLYEQLGLGPESSTWILLDFEKKEFKSRSVLVPASRWGEASKVVRIALSPKTEETTLSKKIINHFFNAKKYAESKQFPQALEEIDKILAIDSQLAQAIVMKAGVYFLQGDMNEAKSLYRKALDIEPGLTDAIQMLEAIQNKVGGAR